MTGRQINKKLENAGISLANVVDAGRDRVEVLAEARDAVMDVLGWDGYRTGYGTWILRADYAVSDADYCDPSNPIHY